MRQLSDIVRHQNPMTLKPSATVKEACCAMRERRVGAVLVVDEDGRLIGIFTGRDAVGRVLAAGKSAAKTALRSVMTAEPVTMTPDKTAIDALRLMWDGGFRHIPLVEDGKLVGIVSRGDFKSHEQDRLEEERELWERI
jgi:CBS domain-containing protein